jgi:HK97 family phage major capsid protein
MAEKTLEENMEATVKIAVDLQSEFESKSEGYDKHVVDTDVAIKAMETKFGEMSEQIQTQTDEKTALKKEVDELTMLVARGIGQVGEDKAQDFMSDQVKEAFSQAMSVERTTFKKEDAAIVEIVTEQVKGAWGHKTTEQQEALIKSILSEGSAVAGGMWCPTPIDARIRKRMFETSPLRSLAEVINVNTKGMEFALDDEDFIVKKVGEVDGRPDTDTPEFGKVDINVHEQYARPKATNAVIEDSTLNLASFIADKASRKFARDQNKAFILGDGIKEARGILNYADADVEVYERNKIGTKQSSTALTLLGDDFIDIQSHLLEEYQANAVWMMHRLIWAKTIKLKDEEGRYLLDPLMLFNGATPRLLGANVRMAGDMPKPTSAGALEGGVNYVAYGDMREGYTILDRLGINVIMDQITDVGYIKWNFRTRYGGGVTNFQAFKRLQAKGS